MKPTWLATLALSLIAQPASAQWIPQESGTKARLRGLGVVGPKVAWASGSGGTCLRTTDAGANWVARPVPGAEALDFRDLHAVDADTAYLLSIGPGEKSRIYKTADGGITWALQYTNRDPRVFLDAIAFWDASRGLAFGDPVGGRFQVFLTDDGGETWRRSGKAGMPPALPGEGAFAASGTCLVALPGTRSAWFATGGATASRVFRTEDAGASWSAAETPVPAGNDSSGIFSLAFRDANHGLAIGGDYKAPDAPGSRLSETSDGGRSWSLLPGAPSGYRSAVAYVPGREGWAVAVGPGGSEISKDGGRTWSPISPEVHHAVAARDGAVWASGDDGKVSRLIAD